jgi:hypothetical protein
LRPVALAIGVQEFQENRVFHAATAGTFRQSLVPMALPWVRAAEVARDSGFELLTADQVAARRIDPRTMTLISYDWPPASEALVAVGARPGILLTLEPPIIAWRFYSRLRSLSAPFPHAFVFKGAHRQLAPGTIYHPLYFPQAEPPSARPPPPPWAERKYLVMINSNKAIVRSLLRWFDKPREVSLKREVTWLLYPPMRSDLYAERLRAIAYFERREGFDLYGEGWQQRHPAVPLHLHNAAGRAYRGTAPAKLDTLSQYRFALAFENTRFPGYVSEKLFDCLFAGCIPVYYGAPDIEWYVPTEAFVDFRRFRAYAELDEFLAHMSPAAAQGYLDAAEAFLASAAFKRFTRESFARRIVEVLKSLD